MARDGGILAPGPERDGLEQSLIAPLDLGLKVGALVMLLKNLPDIDRLVNGSLGSVVGFKDADDVDESDEAIFSTGATRPAGRWPVVEFPVSPDKVLRVVVFPETFCVESPSGQILFSRRQVRPLPLPARR